MMRLRANTGWLLALAVALLLAACGTDQNTAVNNSTPSSPAADAAQAIPGNLDGCVTSYDPHVNYFPDRVQAQYAEGWDVSYANNYKILRTRVTAAAAHAGVESRPITRTYVLVQCGTPAPDLVGELKDATPIQIPITSIVDGGSVLYAALEKLGVAGSLVGHGDESFVTQTEAPSMPAIWSRISSGQAPALGYQVNLEALASIKPDVYTNYAGEDSMFQRISDLKIPVLFYFPYTETPLGAAEELKFTALLYNKERAANEYFKGVESRYLELRARVQSASSKPRVLVGTVSPGKDMTTRQNDRFEPQLVREASGQNVFDLPGGGNAAVSMETAIERGGDADYWFDLAFFPKKSAGEMIGADPRLNAIQALKQGRSFHRMGRGNDYFLTGTIDVDVVLADIVSILHPTVLPNHSLVYLKRTPAE